jgi:hypothetical protein
VHIDEVARRLVEAAKSTRIGPRIKQCLQEAIGYAEEAGRLLVRGDFLWDPQRPHPLLRERSSLPAAARKIRYIAPGELVLAVEKVVREAIAIEPEEVVLFVARLIGFSHLSEEMKNDLLDTIVLCLREGTLVQDGEWLRPAPEVK